MRHARVHIARQALAFTTVAVLGTMAVSSVDADASGAPAAARSAKTPVAAKVPAKGKTPAAAKSGGPTTYVVKDGDTLSDIARKAGVRVSAIQELNANLKPNALRVGAKLAMPKRESTKGKLPAALRDNPSRLKLRPVIKKWAKKNDIPADLVEATLFLESGWNQQRVSSVGAIGVGQLMPDTAAYIRSELIGEAAGGNALREDVAEHNVRMSARYLRYLLQLSNGNVNRALHGYYQGFGSISENGLYPETRNYAASIQALRARFRADQTGA